MNKLTWQTGLSLLAISSAVIMISSCRDEPSGPVEDFPANKVLSLHIDPAGTVWAGSDAGLLSFREGIWSRHLEEELPSGLINGIDYQPSDYGPEIWLSSSKGVGVAVIELDAITSATTYSTENSELLADMVTDVLVDGGLARWFATVRGLSVFKGRSWYRETGDGKLAEHYVLAMDAQDDGWVFAGTNGMGVGRYQFDRETDGITAASYYDLVWTGLTSDTVLAVYVDRNNHQWFGLPNGLARHTEWEAKRGWEIYTTREGLVNSRVQAIAGTGEGTIWVGTPEGVSSFDGVSWKSYTTEDGLVHNYINDIAVDEFTRVWFATQGGVSVFDGSGWTSYSKK